MPNVGPRMATTYAKAEHAKNREVVIIAYGSEMNYPDGDSPDNSYCAGHTGIVQEYCRWAFGKENFTFQTVDVRNLGLTNAEYDQSNPAVNYDVLKHLSIGQNGMWQALVLLIGLIWTWFELRGPQQKLALFLHCAKGKHRAAGTGSLLSIATGFPCYFPTFNFPNVWDARFYFVRLPAVLPEKDEINDFILSAADCAKYPFKSEARRELAWKICQVKHNLVEPDSDLATWVYENNLQDSQDNEGYYSDTEEEKVLADFRGENRTVRRTRRRRKAPTPDNADEEEEDKPVEQSSSSDEEEQEPADMKKFENTKMFPGEAVDDDGFVRVNRTRKGKKLGLDDDVPPKMCPENYTAVDMLEFALYKARQRGGQVAVDNLCLEMAKERES
ncbi:unnamed protein product [Symbiodinium sp. CCMP2592]|nr:unnamed protein product [Symbiodinium sp. CCMP2592]